MAPRCPNRGRLVMATVIILSRNKKFLTRLGAIVRGGKRTVHPCEDESTMLAFLEQQLSRSILVLHEMGTIKIQTDVTVLNIEDTGKKSIAQLMTDIRLVESRCA